MTILAIVGGAVVVFSFLGWLAFRYVRKAGEAEAERKHFQAKSEQARRANEIDEKTGGMSVAQLDDELRDRR